MTRIIANLRITKEKSFQVNDDHSSVSPCHVSVFIRDNPCHLRFKYVVPAKPDRFRRPPTKHETQRKNGLEGILCRGVPCGRPRAETVVDAHVRRQAAPLQVKAEAFRFRSQPSTLNSQLSALSPQLSAASLSALSSQLSSAPLSAFHAAFPSPIRNFGLHQHRELDERFLPAEVARFCWNHRWHTGLLDVHLRAAGDFL